MAKVYRFDFKKLDVYHASVEHFAWTLRITAALPWRFRRVVDQVLGAALSIIANLGEAGGRRLKPAESAQHYRYAQGSTFESAAFLDPLSLMGLIDDDTYNEREENLAAIGSMITRMIERQDNLSRKGRKS